LDARKPPFWRSPNIRPPGASHPLRISRPDDLTKIVVSCSVAIGTFDAFDLHAIEGVFMRPPATPLPLGETGSSPTIVRRGEKGQKRRKRARAHLVDIFVSQWRLIGPHVINPLQRSETYHSRGSQIIITRHCVVNLTRLRGCDKPARRAKPWARTR
jgi:hypothetical protein